MQLIKNYIIRICFIFTIIIANISFATASNDAANYINDLAERVINIVKKTDLEEKEKESILNEIFIQNVDVKWIGRFAMGKFWRRITPDQQEKFLTIYSDYLTGLYVPNFRKYTGNKVKIVNATEVRPNEFLVQTLLTDSTNNLEIKINYMIIKNGNDFDDFIIFDIIAEGVSLITTQRAEINSTMSNNDFNGLINLLIRKTASSSK